MKFRVTNAELNALDRVREWNRNHPEEQNFLNDVQMILNATARENYRNGYLAGFAIGGAAFIALAAVTAYTWYLDYKKKKTTYETL